ncbi:MAG: hypothetical protein NZ528_08385 [Caldilineales bacterium]|nr:hypothetical protein [Caldilineales bacterium]MDW8317597.1 hypothetical protein [Anaerolineae bacterium]
MSQPLWTDVLQATGAIGALIISTVGFAVLIYQVRQLERSIRGNVNESLYNQNLEFLRVLTNNPDLRPYFYENRDVTVEDPKYYQVMSLAEILASFLELIALQKSDIPKHVWVHWLSYIQDMYRSSPVLRQHFRDNKSWYSRDILTLLDNSVASDLHALATN